MYASVEQTAKAKWKKNLAMVKWNKNVRKHWIIEIDVFTLYRAHKTISPLQMHNKNLLYCLFSFRLYVSIRIVNSEPAMFYLFEILYVIWHKLGKNVSNKAHAARFRIQKVYNFNALSSFDNLHLESFF